MKKGLALLAMILLSHIAIAEDAGKGAFLLTKSTNLYENLDLTGKKYLTKRRTAFAVTNISTSKKRPAFFQIEFPFLLDTINGNGFIVESEQELQEIGENKVKVYLFIPVNSSKIPGYILVPPEKLSFSGKNGQSQLFPEVTWRAVDFSVKIPKKLWVSSEFGIYRPDKEVDWLKKVWTSVWKKKYAYTVRRAILRGLVENGFTQEQVLMALGDPLKKVDKEETDDSEWIYPDKKVIFKNGVVQQVL